MPTVVRAEVVRDVVRVFEVVRVLNSHSVLCGFSRSGLGAQIFRGLPWNLSRVSKGVAVVAVTDLAPVVAVMWCPRTRNPRDDRHPDSAFLHPCHTPRAEALGKGVQGGSYRPYASS
jgi:hypothetical protein